MASSLQVSWDQLRLAIGCPELTQHELQYRCIIFLPVYCLSDYSLSVGEWIQLVPDQGNHAIHPIACQVHPEYAKLTGKAIYTSETKNAHDLDDSNAFNEDDDADIKITAPLATYLAWSLMLGSKSGCNTGRPEDLSWSIQKQKQVIEASEVLLDPVSTDMICRACGILDESVEDLILKNPFPLSRQVAVWTNCEGTSLVLHSGNLYLLRAFRSAQPDAGSSTPSAIGITRRTKITILGKSDTITSAKKGLSLRPIVSDHPLSNTRVVNEKLPTSLQKLPVAFHSWFDKTESLHKGRSDEIGALIHSIANSLAFPISNVEVGEVNDKPQKWMREGIPPAIKVVHKNSDMTTLCPSSVFLIEGPTGSGKTHLARTLAETSPFPHVFVAAAELFKSFQGETEASLRSVFARASAAAIQRPASTLQSIPTITGASEKSNYWFANASIIVIDDIDTLTPTRGTSISGSNSSIMSSPGGASSIVSPAEMADASEEGTSAGRNIRLENRIIDTLSELIDAVQQPSSIEQTWRVPKSVLTNCTSELSLVKEADTNEEVVVRVRPRVIVIATTSRMHAVHPQLLRSDRFACYPPITTAIEDDRPLIGSLLKLGPLHLKSRMELLSHLLQVKAGNKPSEERLVQRVAGKMHGYVVSDVIHLVTEAYMGALRRKSVGQLHSSEHSNELLDVIEESDFAHAFGRLGAPSALRSSGLVLNLQQHIDQDSSLQGDQADSSTMISSAFNHLGGRREVIEMLYREIIWPLTSHGEWRDSMAAVSANSKHGTPNTIAVSPVSGILIYGSPGSGKTALAVALAKATSLPVLSIAATSIISKVHGGSEAALDRVFSLAKASSPCLLLLDQLEAICSRESADGSGAPSKLLASFISQLDTLQRDREVMCRAKNKLSIDESKNVGLQNDVIVVGTTSFAKRLDRSLFMPGRIETQIKLDALDQLRRFDVLVKCTQNMPVRCDASGADQADIDDAADRREFNEIFLAEVAEDKWTGGWTPADLKALASEAAMDALRDIRMAGKERISQSNMPNIFVYERHFRAALERMSKRKDTDVPKPNTAM